MLYRVYSATDVLLYVGITQFPRTRIKGHKASSRWYEEAVRWAYTEYPSRKAARAAEVLAIRTEHPLWNVAGRCSVAEERLLAREAASA